MTGIQGPRWRVRATSEEIVRDAVAQITATAGASILARGEFKIALAGGNTPRAVYRNLSRAGADWARWRIYFGDERCLAPDDSDRNSRMAQDAWLAHAPIPRERIHAIPAELGAEAGAKAYCDALDGAGLFDFVLLGLGEDGHTASLFPGHDWGADAAAPAALAVFGAPKPPPERVSLSAWRLSAARRVLFLVTGESKREAVAAWRAGTRIPAAAIIPEAGVDILVEACSYRA